MHVLVWKAVVHCACPKSPHTAECEGKLCIVGWEQPPLNRPYICCWEEWLDKATEKSIRVSDPSLGLAMNLVCSVDSHYLNQSLKAAYTEICRTDRLNISLFKFQGCHCVLPIIQFLTRGTIPQRRKMGQHSDFVMTCKLQSMPTTRHPSFRAQTITFRGAYV